MKNRNVLDIEDDGSQDDFWGSLDDEDAFEDEFSDAHDYDALSEREIAANGEMTADCAEFDRVLRAAQLAERDEARKTFGAECRSMIRMLAVFKLPNSFADAKPWVRLFGGEEGATKKAVEWLAEGWTNAELHGALSDTLLIIDDAAKCSRLLSRHGFTPSMLEDPDQIGPWVEEGMIDFFERLVQEDNARTPEG